ncbi:hypothetical protein MJO28_006467 [Puccinia striiformis f. sp. tritici]|uniref:Uncharacterized protein n=4 Tax=Puccinia striiformis TaxID=27350 RepID=A0A0L0VIM9_9BASI|nr:hypothetical protein Pst134EA_011643 [Puccinia striiformis f. sp. tritici]KAI9605232.1 hypothetical protein H4Q26_003210 [Puccinia striiformis f. sp. tritici PST-130]KNE99118.1 hypothetical protein PSTG_07597 [Puccinia striiformis f. sp. tritici PST-78]POW01265.1 hypothetical protein PSTT_12581 [Puccinia striiformis]KAH9456416.1 hypothetical protein Pst134EB_012613 [Puccinia striiformis f. sp. tritici]KAH9468021.1 hypothetical protein Pst134EA_011643 [Puccinia striiformis f. sp. tritici]
MAYSLRTEDISSHHINLINRMHTGLFAVSHLSYANQMEYYNTRIVLCQRPTTMASTNRELLTMLGGAEVSLRAYCPWRGTPSSLLYASPGDNLNIPDNRIPVKRSMVLRLLDNKGHEDHLEVGDRLLLIVVCRFVLVVKPLAGMKKGLNLGIHRLMYLNSRQGAGRGREYITQFPVVGGFAVMDDLDYSELTADQAY